MRRSGCERASCANSPGVFKCWQVQLFAFYASSRLEAQSQKLWRHAELQRAQPHFIKVGFLLRSQQSRQASSKSSGLRNAVNLLLQHTTLSSQTNLTVRSPILLVPHVSEGGFAMCSSDAALAACASAAVTCMWHGDPIFREMNSLSHCNTMSTIQRQGMYSSRPGPMSVWHALPRHVQLSIACAESGCVSSRSRYTSAPTLQTTN